MIALWKKTPAWIKALLLNILWLYPTNFAVQAVVQTNLRTNSSWGWGLIPSIFLLVAFWYAAKKFCFKSETNIKLRFNAKDIPGRSWLSAAGVVIMAIGISLLCAWFFDIESTRQAISIGLFRQFRPSLAIPLLTALALMAAIVEEVVYRGIMQNTLSVYPKWLNYSLIAILFALAHLLPMTLLVPYMLLSILFSVLADKWKSIFPAIVAHFFIDIIVFLCLYFEVIDLANLKPYHIVVSLIFISTGSLMLFLGLKNLKSTSADL